MKKIAQKYDRQEGSHRSPGMWRAVLFVFILGAHGIAAPLMTPPRQATGVSLQNCRVVVPEVAALRTEVEELARELRRRGGEVSVVPPGEALDDTKLRLRVAKQETGGESPRETLILVGNINTNRAMLPLYAALLDFTDGYHPGGDGYVLRTVLDAPSRGTDCIVLGGSSEAGMERAVREGRELVSALKPGEAFPLTLKVELAGDALSNLKSIGIPGSAPYAGYLYGLTGDRRFAQAARQEMLNPPGEPSSYGDGDYGLEQRLRAWAMMCDSGVFANEELQRVQQSFLNTLIKEKDQYWRARGGGSIGSRHQTMGTSAFHSIVRYLLRRGSPNAEASELLNRWSFEGEAYFANAVTTFHDDFEGIPTFHSIQPIADYALETGVAEYFTQSGGMSPLEQAILRAYASVDNLGFYCGTGTYEEARPGTVKAGIMLGYPLTIAACVTRDSRALWLLRHFKGTGIYTWGLISGYGAHAFNVAEAVPEKEPVDWLGIVRSSLGEYRYSRLAHARDESHPGSWYLPTPYERTFEKLCFRDTFDPEGQYLVLEGFQGAGADNAAPYDANSILRYTDRGVPWLIANTDRQSNFYRNAVYVSDGETATPGWAGCELVGEAKAGNAHLVVSKLGDYSDSEWTRNILWLRGKGFAVIDTVRFEKPGDRQVFCTFRTSPPAVLNGREWVARSGEAEFHLINADRCTLMSRREGLEGAAIPTVLRQVQALKASGTAPAVFRNLFYVTTPDRQQRLEVRPISDNGMLIWDRTGNRGVAENGGPTLFAVRGAGDRLKAGPFESDGAALCVGPEGLCVVGGKDITLNGRPLSARDAAAYTPAVRQLMLQLWRQSVPDNPPATKQQSRIAKLKPSAATPTLDWRYADLEPRRPSLLSPIVSASEPPSTGSLDDLTDGFIPLWSGDAVWQNPAGVTLTFDLRQSEDLSSIEFATGLIAAGNIFPSPDKLPKDWTATIQFSNDGFRKDTRGGEAVLRAGFTIEPLHKGTVFPMGRWSLSGLKERARYVRIIFPGPIGLREVYLRRSAGTEARFGPSLITDLNGDGREDIVVTTDTGELVVLGSDGKKQWGRKFAGPVSCLKAGALSNQGPTMLLVGTWEARLYCFSPEGRQQWVADFLPLGGDLPVPYSIALTNPGPDGKRSIVVGNYARVSFLSTEGKLLSHSFAHGAFETQCLTDGMDFDGEAGEEGLLYNVWASLSVVSLSRQAVTRYIPCPRGEGLCLQRWGRSSPKDPVVLVASDNGLGLLHPASGQYTWQKGLAPLSCVKAVDLDGDGAEEILAGKTDGWILELSESGEVKRKVMVGDEVRSTVTLPSHPRRVWILTGSDLRVYDEHLAVVGIFKLPAVRVEPLGQDRIVTLGEEGEVSAFQVKRLLQQ